MDIGILVPANIPQVIVEVVKVMERIIKRPATLPKVIVEVVYVGQVLTDTLPLVIAEDMLIEVDMYHNIPATLPLVINKQELMLKGGGGYTVGGDGLVINRRWENNY